MNPDAPTPRPGRLAVAVVATLLGCVSIIVGVVGALGPLLTWDASACVYNISPPDEFVEKHQEGITATAETISLLPFGAQCSYIATSTGEVALSIVPLWPTFAVLGGLLSVAVGLIGIGSLYGTNLRRVAA